VDGEAHPAVVGQLPRELDAGPTALLVVTRFSAS
jgi:hypothetical protein